MLYTFVPVLLLRTLIVGSALSIVVACAAEPSTSGSSAQAPASTVSMQQPQPSAGLFNERG